MHALIARLASVGRTVPLVSGLASVGAKVSQSRPEAIGFVSSRLLIGFVSTRPSIGFVWSAGAIGFVSSPSLIGLCSQRLSQNET
jgi:hypothetical protein